MDFATKQEARNAMEAVQGAHLYGRRLVLEWAEEEGGLDELRAKTGDQACCLGEGGGLGVELAVSWGRVGRRALVDGCAAAGAADDVARLA